MNDAIDTSGCVAIDTRGLVAHQTQYVRGLRCSARAMSMYAYLPCQIWVGAEEVADEATS